MSKITFKKALIIVSEDSKTVIETSSPLTFHFYPKTEKQVSITIPIDQVREALESYCASGVLLGSANIESNKSLQYK